MCSHEGVDVSHPEFFSSAKQNGYVPPNKEVLVFCLNTYLHDLVSLKLCYLQDIVNLAF